MLLSRRLSSARACRGWLRQGARQRIRADAEAFFGVGHLFEERLRFLAEGVGEDGVVFGEHLVERGDLALQVRDAFFELLVQARELAKPIMDFVAEPARPRSRRIASSRLMRRSRSCPSSRELPLKRRIASVRMGSITTTEKPSFCRWQKRAASSARSPPCSPSGRT